MLERLGRYEILETIAAGGQGTVYRARDGASGDVVALKVMHPGHTGEVQYLEALRQEANLASRLDHPNIVKVFDFQVEGGTAYVAMEYVPGVLRSEMQPGKPLSLGRAVELAKQVSSAMAHAHQHGVVHRDIKPQNILLKEDGSVAVSDFGIARASAAALIACTSGVSRPTSSRYSLRAASLSSNKRARITATMWAAPRMSGGTRIGSRIEGVITHWETAASVWFIIPILPQP